MLSDFAGKLRSIAAATAVAVGSMVAVTSAQAVPLFEIDGAPFTDLAPNFVLPNGLSGTPTFQEGSIAAPLGSTISLRRFGWEGRFEVRVFCDGTRCDTKPAGSFFPDSLEDPNNRSKFPLPGAPTANPGASVWTHTSPNANNTNLRLRLNSRDDSGAEFSNINNVNIDGPGTRPPNGPSLIFAYIDGNSYSSTPTNTVVFGFDDFANGADDNHDDYMGVLTVTPIPGAVWLFGTAALGLAAVHRRRKAAAAAA